MRKRMTIMIIALGIIFGGIIGYNIFKGIMMKRYFAHFESPAVTVSSVTVKEQNWEPRLPAVGNFSAMNGVNVGSEAAGNVVQLLFDSGQFISKDELLLVIDDSVEQAKLKYNQSELTLQQLNYKRMSDLFKRGATPSSSVDEAKARLQQAEANVESTQAAIAQKHIKAPFTGKLGIRQVSLGQYITPGQTNIVTLQSLDPLFLEFYLPEQLLPKLHLNQPINFTVEQNPDVIFEGKITALNAKVDINTHNILIQATVPNCPSDVLTNLTKTNLFKTSKDPNSGKTLVQCDSELNQKNKIKQYNFIPGMFAAIDISQPKLPNVIVLPTTAISYSLYGNSVFLINKEKTDEGKEILKVKRTFIETGDQQGNYTVVTKGLKAGQIVVSSGDLKLEDDTRVEINNTVNLPNIAPVKLSE
ncbi:acriflavin resistance protein (plasmid) [Legionella adelaidensis]|uniref:Acriflavin resistance protein n=1 Tax=Legionella adelaidensis TaxID=45056 RepID=A0A0W0R572_9GAMM|nr:efflux RND transporter periplasmic adaptor subunit [Legionella adelaidensis]KTC66178.1 acriflavin resistance protein E [Legionella adelaidensis]VEH85579.1 acriflavin resistance protein [Legionella adelaidensis]